MSSIAAITLNALFNDQARIERIASNLANVTTPGYKREVWVEHAGPLSQFGRLVEGGDAQAKVSSSETAAGVAGATLARDPRPGTLRPTGRSLDLALAGPGFFELATDQGPVYTRQGEFQVDARGRIVNAHGQALMGEGGEITVTSDQLLIDSDGRISEAGKPVGRLRVIDWAPNQLTASGNGAFTGSGAARQLEGNEVMVRQRFLENANVDTAHEMVALSATMRHFEAMLRVAQGRDELLGTAIRKLGDL